MLRQSRYKSAAVRNGTIPSSMTLAYIVLLLKDSNTFLAGACGRISNMYLECSGYTSSSAYNPSLDVNGVYFKFKSFLSNQARPYPVEQTNKRGSRQ